MENAIHAKYTKSPTTLSKRRKVDLDPNVQKARIELDGCTDRVAELETRVSELEKSLQQAGQKMRVATSRYCLFYSEHNTLMERM